MIKNCDYPCNDKSDAELEEDRHMIELKANMNTIRGSRTIKQYYEDNKDKIKEHIKKYREDNKDKIKERKSKKCTCECGTIYIHGNKARHIKTIKHQKYLNTIE